MMSVIRDARERKGFSQEHLAGAAEVGVRTIQRVEAGERVSPEVLISICAILGLTPEQAYPRPPAAVSPETLPQVARVRRALDEALRDSGERPTWRLPDPTPRLHVALANMGETQDEAGFERAAALTRQRSGMVLRRFALGILLGLWSVGLVGILGCETLAYYAPAFGHIFHNGKTVPFPSEIFVILPVTLLILARIAWRVHSLDGLISPGKGGAVLRKGIFETDLDLRDVAQTRDALWMATATKGTIAIRRIGLDLLTKVEFAANGDGANSVVFTEGDTRHTVNRLPDVDLDILRKRFGTRSTNAWTLVPASS